MTKLYIETPLLFSARSTSSATLVENRSATHALISYTFNTAMDRTFETEIEQCLLPSAPNRQRRLVVTLANAINQNSVLS